jgi:hypothetical protein
MMWAQRNAVKDEMAYLHRKMREQLTKYSTANDQCEKEILSLKAENKTLSLSLSQTLLARLCF